MKWLTQEEIRKEAKKSKLAAVRISKKHWWQLATATSRELRQALKSETTSICRDFCGLCYRYYDKHCKSCPLNCLTVKKESLWQAASSKYFCWVSKNNFIPFHKAARKLHRRLCELERKYTK